MSQPTTIVLEEKSPGTWEAQVEGGPMDGATIVDKSPRLVLEQVGGCIERHLETEVAVPQGRCGGKRLVSMGLGVKGLVKCPGCRDCVSYDHGTPR